MLSMRSFERRIPAVRMIDRFLRTSSWPPQIASRSRQSPCAFTQFVGPDPSFISRRTAGAQHISNGSALSPATRPQQVQKNAPAPGAHGALELPAAGALNGLNILGQPRFKIEIRHCRRDCASGFAAPFPASGCAAADSIKRSYSTEQRCSRARSLHQARDNNRLHSHVHFSGFSIRGIGMRPEVRIARYIEALSEIGPNALGM
jgi:hypothetical protein